MEESKECGKREAICGWDLTDSRDEMNLAEFPLSCMSDRAPRGVKTLVFEDEVWDTGKNETVARKLTIAGSDDYGLPTALDEDVLVFLIKLTKQTNGFSDTRVHFSRYQLIQLLGWDEGGKSYKRLDESLHRWAGVTLRYKRAWWDKRGERWKDQAFHVLESVELCGRENGGNQINLPLSQFTWNGVLFSSFQSGYIKQLNLEVYKRLRLSGTKRAYRFLDKRFYHKPRWEFSLNEFACQRIGLSRNYDTANMKRKLRAIIDELVDVGFIRKRSESDRFIRVGPGEWRVVFEQMKSDGPRETVIEKRPAVDGIPMELTSRGVTPKVAAELAGEYSPERVMEKIELYDWYTSKNDKRMGDNPAGFLVAAIKGDYTLPKGFESKATREAKAKKKTEREAEKRKVLAEEEARKANDETEKQLQESTVRCHLETLTELEEIELFNRALLEASDTDRKYYENAKKMRTKIILSEAKTNVLYKYLVRHGQSKSPADFELHDVEKTEGSVV